MQNRNKLIELFIGNVSNAIVHQILEKAIDDENIRDHYDKELTVSFDKAKSYREKINPVNTELPDKDIGHIKDRIISKVKGELNLRIVKGYENVEITSVESMVDKVLKDMRIIPQ